MSNSIWDQSTPTSGMNWPRTSDLQLILEKIANIYKPGINGVWGALTKVVSSLFQMKLIFFLFCA
jgi:hypothetical protein